LLPEHENQLFTKGQKGKTTRQKALNDRTATSAIPATFYSGLILLMQKGHYYRQGNDNTNYGFPILKHD
jgi:hypothetical protein